MAVKPLEVETAWYDDTSCQGQSDSLVPVLSVFQSLATHVRIACRFGRSRSHRKCGIGRLLSFASAYLRFRRGYACIRRLRFV
jgi:hypothetical protein